MKLETSQGTVTATLEAAKPVSGRLAGGPIREVWHLKLMVGNVEISVQKRTLEPGRMTDAFCREWARLQTAEGYQANAEYCQQLINELPDLALE